MDLSLNIEIDDSIESNDDNIWQNAVDLMKQKRFIEAAKLYLSISNNYLLHEEQSINNIDYLIEGFGWAGYCYLKAGDHKNAIKCYKKSVVYAEKIENKNKMAIRYFYLADIYKTEGLFEDSLSYYNNCLIIYKELKQVVDEAIIYNSMGTLFYYRSKFDKALYHFHKSLHIFEKEKEERYASVMMNNIGMVYSHFGQHEKALYYYEKALQFAENQSQNIHIAVRSNNIGSIYYELGDYKNALFYFEKSLDIKKKFSDEDDVSISLVNIGMVYYEWGKYDKAIEYLKQSLLIDMNNNKKKKVAAELNNLGIVYEELGLYKKAIRYYEKALNISKKLGVQEYIASGLANIGVLYYHSDEYAKAIDKFKESIEITEEIRKTADYDERRDYLSEQIYSYQLLISSYIRQKKIYEAFYATEISRARILFERLNYSENIKVPDINEVQNQIKSDEIVIIYANTDLKHIVQIAITKDSIYGLEIPIKSFVTSVFEKCGNTINNVLKKYHKTNSMKFIDSEKKFARIISGLYVFLIDRWNLHNDKIVFIGKMLYNLLISPIKKQIDDKRKLIVIPDYILSIIPFEIFINEENQYLIEKYNIKYVNSIAVLHSIRKRKYHENRKSMIAFGDAIYEDQNQKTYMNNNEKLLKKIKQKIYSGVEEKEIFNEAYRSLGLTNWSKISGAKKELQEILKIIPNSRIVTKKQVSKERIKHLSKTGELKKYKAIHFALHAIVVPEIPELSSLVLSQSLNLKQDDDVYLRTNEIAKLSINADFVNLSACDTALGKIYEGEGVVGFIHAFFIAGANSLSVSLWSIDDEITSVFMKEMYNETQMKNYSYDIAIANVKNNFIKGKFGENYKIPFYWAPYVYYGS